VDWAGWALFGLVATAALTIVMIAAQLAGLTRLDLPLVLGTLVVEDPDRARVAGVGCQKSKCHAAYSYSWITPPRTSRRRSRLKFGALLAAVRSDGTGVAWAKLRCGRRWL
jgi:hypothetical protein